MTKTEKKFLNFCLFYSGEIQLLFVIYCWIKNAAVAGVKQNLKLFNLIKWMDTTKKKI
jgi:hypothetical protein